MAEAANPASTPAPEAPETETPETETPASQQEPAAEPAKPGVPDLEALVQRAVDRATNRLGNENKRLRQQLDDLRKSKLSDDEVRQLELQEREKELADRDKALTDKENRWFAMREIKAAGLDDGGSDSMAIVDFVMAADEDGIKERVKTFSALIQRLVKAQVDATFRANGRTPGVGTDSPAPAGQPDSFSTRMGKEAAAAQKKSRSILDHYIGGK